MASINMYRLGLCGCMYDKAATIDVCCCWSCQISRQLNAVGDPAQLNECSCLKCIPALICPHLCTCCVRMKVAEKFQIDEGCCGSGCRALLCPGCSLCQTHAELTVQGVWPGGQCFQKQPPDVQTIQ